MASLDSVSIAIFLGAVLVMAGILSSLLALRFGAPLLLVFLLIGMLAGDAGPGQLSFDDVRTTYLVGSVALALILFDGGLRTKFQSIRTVLAPSMVLATIGVLVTALVAAPAAKYALDLNWTEALLVGAVVASTDAAAVFLLVHTQGLRLRPRVGATLEAESGTNDPFAIFLTLMLVEFISLGESSPWHVVLELAREGLLGAVIGVIGGRLVVVALNRMALPQGLHAPFVATAALVIFGVSQISHASGFLAVYLAGIIVGNRPTRAHNSVVTFLDAATWLAQIVMFVLLGPAGVAAAPAGQRGPLRDRGAGADAGGAAARGAAVPGAVPVQLAGKGLHRLDRPARGGRDLSGLDPDAGRACRKPISISTSPWSWSSSRCCCRAGRWGRRRGGCTWRCRASTAVRGASSSICRASSNSNWSAIPSARRACISGAACFHPGRSRRW